MKMIMIMKSSVLLAIVMITFTDWCCAVTKEDGSGVDIPQEATTLHMQYCIIDNSTILRLDTGEKLDIIFTSNSILVVSLNRSQTSMAIPRLHNELVCSMHEFPGKIVLPTPIYIILSVWTAVILSLAIYNIVVHIKPRNPMGKLLMWYSIFLALQIISFFMFLTLLYKLFIDFHHVCHTIKVIFIAADIAYKATATCILHHCAYNLWQSYKMRPVDSSEDKVLSRRYFGYIICTIVISMFIILTYDLAASNGNFNGYCNQNDPIYANMINLMYTVSYINKMIQVALFIIFLYYWYKLRNSLDLTMNQKLVHIAVGMGATISISEFIFSSNWIIALATDTNLSILVETIGSMMLLLQHCIIVGVVRWVKNVYKAFCKKEVAMTS